MVSKCKSHAHVDRSVKIEYQYPIIDEIYLIKPQILNR